MKTRKLGFLIGIVLLVTSLCSASSMWKASPFYEERDNVSKSEVVNRVNLWPIFYHYKPYTSALWPMFDKRDDGYALRPFFSVYRNGNELNVLWPLSSFNFGEKKYHILNTFWSTNFFVSLPFYLSIKDEFWIAPLVAGKGKDWYSVMPPLWVHNYESANNYSFFCMPFLTYFEREESDYSFTTFPLYHQSKWGERFEQSFLLFLYDFEKHGSNYNFSIFPFFSQSRYGKTFEQKALLSLYEYEKSPFLKRIELFPFFDCYFSSTRTNLNILPFYFFEEKNESTRHALFPFFYKKKEKDKNTLITPLFGTLIGSNVHRVITPLVSVSRKNHDHFVNVLGLLYNHAWNDEKKYNRTDIIYPLFTHKQKKDVLTVSSLPLFYYNKSSNNYKFISPVSFGKNKEKKFFNLFGPVFHSSWNKKMKNINVCWPLFSCYRDENKSEIYSFPLFNYEKNKSEKSGSILWPLYNYKFKKDGSYNHFIFPLAGRGHNVRERRILEGKTDSKETTTQNWTWILPFTYWNNKICYERDFSVPIPDEIRLKDEDRINWEKIIVETNAWKSYASKHYKPYKRIRRGSFPFFSYLEKENISSEFRILFWLFDSKWTAAKKDFLENTHRRILWRLMDYEKSGENVSMDIFPFITYDKIPEKEISQFSVFWRLFRWREEKEKRALDILFIPFRWGK